MKRILSLSILAAVAASILFIGCQPKGGIKIGAVLPLTGNSAQLGELARNALTLLEQDVNSKGGVRGRKLKVVLEDGAADPNTSVSAMNKLVSVDHVGYVLTSHSGVGLALAPIADKDKVLLFVHASHPKITGASPFVFRHSNIAEQESRVIVDFLRSKQRRTCVLAVMNDDYGMAFKGELTRLFVNDSIVASTDVAYDQSETDYKTVAQKLLQGKRPDVVIVAGLGNGVGLLIRRLREFGFQGDVVITLGALITGAFQSAGEAGKGVYYIDFAFSADAGPYKDLAKRYEDAYHNGLQSTSVLFYNTGLLLVQAIEKAGDDPVKVSAYLAGLSVFSGVGEDMRILNKHDIVPSLQVLQK